MGDGEDGMTARHTGLRAGVYVDVENVSRNGGRGMRYDVLRDFASRDGAEPIRLNAYLAFDEERAKEDAAYRANATSFHFALRGFGYKVIDKPVQWYTAENGLRISKANSDLDLAVDLLLQTAKLDRVVLVTGDGDFVQVVRALQNTGCRVELIAFESVSYALRCECDYFLSGYLVPGLLSPTRGLKWGDVNARVRGTCCYYNPQKHYGFLRHLADLNSLSITDPLAPGSPYRDVFFADHHMPPDLDLSLLPNRDMIFEFTVVPGNEPGKRTVDQVQLIYRY
jgi:uncharacterized LabA/DUF88 family protein